MGVRNLKTKQSLYSLSYFTLFGAIAALSPFFPLLLQSKGFEPSRIGFLLGSYEMISIMGLLLIGHFYDSFRSPRRTIFTICLASIIVLFLIAREENLIMIVPLTLAMGFVIKSPASLMDAHYGQNIPNAEKSYGKARLFGSLGFFTVAMLIQLTGIVEASRPLSIFRAFSILLSISMALLIFLPKAHQHKNEKVKTSFLSKVKSFPLVFWAGLGIAFFNHLGMSGHYTFFSLLMSNKFGRTDVGGLWAIGPLFELPLFFFSAWLLQKLGLKKLWIIGLAAGFIRMQVYSLSSTILPLYVVQICHSVSFGFNHLCMITLITRFVPTESRGLAMALFSAVSMGLSLFVGGFLGGWILHHSGYTLLFQVLSAAPLLGIVTAGLFLKENRSVGE
ncbi:MULTISPECIES: MFS transporter [unclassified Oceanispirochaeta]|uniref:MFS transporter n=1 Tax=unclassified Oceanispirochaeta TaxID=2635722 RepID=UPI000E09460F|nr:MULTISPECIES: MFS transporter [unclassified Oceanispirochaeta]MBF9018145.1 MFS transporter [Oceanispirochaeta sp. M2]NPD74609.1 MFS transporter [Oceanispirochaeta sp. M1]RDG29560.1 MFS transporter [Oceanispirochaeta sp. M1]